MYRSVWKRCIDLSIALPAFLIAIPIIGVIAIVIYMQDKENPFFTQTRPGLNNQLFRLVKLRTMNNKRNTQGDLLPDDQRLTTFGKVVRKTSLDELPQLYSVLKGDMSLVGPRPLLVQYLPLYNDRQKRRHLVRPGITGWAQINGRNAISWQQKFELDVWYVDHISLGLDIRILLLTLKKVIVREGINSQGSVTAEYFNGNN